MHDKHSLKKKRAQWAWDAETAMWWLRERREEGGKGEGVWGGGRNRGRERKTEREGETVGERAEEGKERTRKLHFTRIVV